MLYGDLRTKFIDRMKRRDLTTALADGFLVDAITRAQRVVRVPAMEKYIDVLLTNDAYFTNNRLAIPSDYLGLKHLKYTGGPAPVVLTNEPLSYVAQLNGTTTGDPSCYAREAGGWILAPYPLATSSFTDPAGNVFSPGVRIVYYAEFPTEAQVTDDMILSDIASDLMVFGALSYACDHWSDIRGDRFEKRFTQIVSDIQMMADNDELINARVVQVQRYPDDWDGL